MDLDSLLQQEKVKYGRNSYLYTFTLNISYLKLMRLTKVEEQMKGSQQTIQKIKDKAGKSLLAGIVRTLNPCV